LFLFSAMNLPQKIIVKNDQVALNINYQKFIINY
jgi:hypothetical protein